MKAHEIVTLGEAASFLSKQTNGLFAVDNILRIIAAGAQNQLPIYWRNSLQRFSALIGGDGKTLAERAVTSMRVSLYDLSRLEEADEILVTMFAPDEDDRSVLREAGFDDGFLAIIDEPGSVTVSRGGLFVRIQDLLTFVGEFGDQSAGAADADVARVSVGRVAPLQRSAAQDQAILGAIAQAGYDALALPINVPGKSGVKAVIRKDLSRDQLFAGAKVFDKAWDRLRQSGSIVDKA